MPYAYKKQKKILLKRQAMIDFFFMTQGGSL